MDTLRIEWHGRTPYEEGLTLQETAVAQLTHEPESADHLLLVEHPHTYTLGVRGNRDNLLVSEARLAQQGVSVHHVRRGGDVTYHGPGQLVGYPIFNVKRTNERLGKRPLDVRAFIHTIQNSIIQTLNKFDIDAWHDDRYPGVWIEKNGSQAKIAAIGVHINRQRISSHGFALNIQPEMHFFDQIIPCGIQEYQVTSMAEVLERPLTLQQIIPHISEAFCEQFRFAQDEGERV